MRLNDLIRELNLTVLTSGRDCEQEVVGGYTSDLLSDVMGNIKEGMIWITLQRHRNVIAVASHKKAVAVLLINGVQLDKETLEQAQKEGVTILTTQMPAFEASGAIYELLKK